ncbi:MAG: hypothetical protein LBF40_10135 [Deltaproteobacteria bacterium]|jgi:hypothetical protein|nr:hypothetical protein [Deltaproteobacteria bacterium]
MDKRPSHRQFKRYSPVIDRMFDKPTLLRWAGALAALLGPNGKGLVHDATKYPPNAIDKETMLSAPDSYENDPGEGAPAGLEASVAGISPGFEETLVSLMGPGSWDESPLRWTSKDSAGLAEDMVARNFPKDPALVRKTLRSQGFRPCGDPLASPSCEGPFADRKFEYMGKLVAETINSGSPVASIHTRLLGECANEQPIAHLSGTPNRKCGAADRLTFVQSLGDFGFFVGKHKNEPFANGIFTTIDLPFFPLRCFSHWWDRNGRSLYPSADTLLIALDSGGHPSYSAPKWTNDLQKHSDSKGLTIKIAHSPSGWLKWSCPETPLFSMLSVNFTERPIRHYITLLSLLCPPPG